MKFSSSILTLGLAVGSVVAEPITHAARDLETFEGIISDISDDTGALDTEVTNFSGGDGASVEEASKTLVETINSGVETAKGSEQLSSTDALALTEPVQALTEKVNTLIDNLIDKKSAFVDAGLGGKIKENLNIQYEAADALAQAISSKVPENLSDIAEQLSSGITDAIQRGIDEYKDVPEGGDGGGGEEPQPTETGGEPAPTPTKTGGDGNKPPGSSSSGGSKPTGTGGLPIPSGGSPTATTPPYTGAAVANKYNAGALVAAAAVFAF